MTTQFEIHHSSDPLAIFPRCLLGSLEINSWQVFHRKFDLFYIINNTFLMWNYSPIYKYSRKKKKAAATKAAITLTSSSRGSIFLSANNVTVCIEPV